MAQLNVASVLNVNYRWLLKYERNRYATQNIKKNRGCEVATTNPSVSILIQGVSDLIRTTR